MSEPSREEDAGLGWAVVSNNTVPFHGELKIVVGCAVGSEIFAVPRYLRFVKGPLRPDLSGVSLHQKPARGARGGTVPVRRVSN